MMDKKFFSILIIAQIFILVLNSDEISLTITRSKNHEEKTGKLTPLVVSISSEDRYSKSRYKTNTTYITRIIIRLSYS